MLGWVFNISIISLLVILIFHYAFDFFAPNKSTDNIIDLKVQKYKNIIDAMVQQQKETNFKKAYEQETGDPLAVEDDGLEELELYLRELAVPL
jgi:hypothetical protein